MLIIFGVVIAVVLIFLIWGRNEVSLRDHRGRLLSRRVKSADEGALVGLAYGRYLFEIWHFGLFHLRPHFVKTVELEHNKLTENEWNFSFKLEHDRLHLNPDSRNPEMRHAYAEYLTDCEILKAVKGSYFKVLNNLYLPRNSISDTTVVDTLLIHPTGIYLFENKMEEGWVFGGLDEKYWSLSKVCRDRIDESEFENPVLRSSRNQEALRRIFEPEPDLRIQSFAYVVFQNALFKQVPDSSVEMKIVLRSQLLLSLKRTFNVATPLYTERQIDAIAETLSGYADKDV